MHHLKKHPTVALMWIPTWKKGRESEKEAKTRKFLQSTKF